MGVTQRNGERCTPKAASTWFHHNWRELQDIPAPSQRWRVKDIDISKRALKQLLHFDALTVVDTDYIIENNNSVNVYHITTWAWELLQDVIPTTSTGPFDCCERSWIKNEYGVDGITCGNCGEIHE